MIKMISMYNGKKVVVFCEHLSRRCSQNARVRRAPVLRCSHIYDKGVLYFRLVLGIRKIISTSRLKPAFC